MAIKTIYHNDIAIIKVGSSATIQQANDLKRSIENDMNNNIIKFIIDLSECEHFDSTFIGFLVVTLKKLKTVEGSLKIIKPKNVFQSMLQKFGGSKLLDMYDSIYEVLNRLSIKKVPKSSLLELKFVDTYSI